MRDTAGTLPVVPEVGSGPALRVRPRQLRDGFREEWFSGELVLEDLERLEPEDAGAARAILLRFLAAQYFTNELRGDWPPHLLRQQRSAALDALGRGLSLDREQQALHAALERCAAGWRPAVVRLLGRSAAAAAARAYPAGALALQRICFEAALVHGWWAEAAAAALEIAGAPGLVGADRARSRWRRRAGVLAARSRPEPGLP